MLHKGFGISGVAGNLYPESFIFHRWHDLRQLTELVSVRDQVIEDISLTIFERGSACGAVGHS